MVGRTSEQFTEALLESRERTNDLAVSWARKGINVWLPPLMVAGRHGTTEECMDSGDLFVTLRVEHKVSGTQWSSKEDYPFSDVIVDEAYKVRDKADPLLCYVMESADRKCAAVIYGWTRPHWFDRQIHDTRSGRDGVFTFCPKKYVRFCAATEVI